MKVSHFGGTVDCETMDAFEAVLNMRYGTEVNEFWIYDKEKNPCLAILVNHEYANLTYFPEDGHPGFQSVGRNPDLNLRGMTIFYTNTPYEEIEVSNDAIVRFFQSAGSGKRVFMSLTQPTCIEWLEL